MLSERRGRISRWFVFLEPLLRMLEEESQQAGKGVQGICFHVIIVLTFGNSRSNQLRVSVFPPTVQCLYSMYEHNTPFREGPYLFFVERPRRSVASVRISPCSRTVALIVHRVYERCTGVSELLRSNYLRYIHIASSRGGVVGVRHQLWIANNQEDAGTN